MSAKTDFIIEKFPRLAGKESFIQVILDIRQAFKLEKVPFRIITPDLDTGSLERFYGAERNKIIETKLKAKNKARKEHARKRGGSPGWVRY